MITALTLCSVCNISNLCWICDRFLIDNFKLVVVVSLISCNIFRVANLEYYILPVCRIYIIAFCHLVVDSVVSCTLMLYTHL